MNETKEKEISTTGKSTSQSRNSRTKRGAIRDKFRNKKSKGEKFGNRTDSTNDISWYAANADLLRDSSSINFSEPTGSDIYGNVVGPAGVTIAPYLKRIPGVCSLRIKPTFGTHGDNGPVDIVNPITTASKQVYSFVRHANSGHSNYDAPDLMLYILAMGDVYSYIVWCQRLYAYSMMYDARNKYLPRALITANQVNYDDLLNHLADFRYWLNAFISKVTAFAVPATFSYMSRKAFLYKNLYIEGPSIKDQMYQLVPGAFLKFAIDATTHKGKLTYADLPDSTAILMTTQEVMDFGELLFKALWDQEDFGIMSGDILKAYGDNIIKLQGVDEVVPIMPLMDEVVLTQFKNATVIPTLHESVDFYDLQQADNGELYGGLDIGSSPNTRVTVPTDAVLSIDAADVTPEMVMESTRLMVVPKTYDNEQLAMGTEVVVQVRYSITPDDTNTPYVKSDNIHTTNWDHSGYAQAMFAKTQFKYAPKFYFLNVTDQGDINWGTLFDVDNYAILHYSDIRKIHEAALLNMLNVPSVGKI